MPRRFSILPIATVLLTAGVALAAGQPLTPRPLAGAQVLERTVVSTLAAKAFLNRTALLAEILVDGVHQPAEERKASRTGDARTAEEDENTFLLCLKKFGWKIRPTLDELRHAFTP